MHLAIKISSSKKLSKTERDKSDGNWRVLASTGESNININSYLNITVFMIDGRD